MNQEELISALGVNFLKGKVSKVWVDDKFYLVDNLEGNCNANLTDNVFKVSKLRFPLKAELTVSLYCKQGRIALRIQQKDYVLEAGNVLVIFGGQIIEKVELSEDSRVIFIAIDSEYIMTEIRGPHGRSLRQWVLHNQLPALLHVDSDEAENYETLCRSLKFIVRSSDDETRGGVLSGFTYIFASLLLKWRKRDVNENLLSVYEEKKGVYPREKEVLMAFQSDIHNFSRKDRTVNFYARRQFISEKHFSRLIKKASGQKPLDIIREYVILDAKSLLLSGSYSVKQVSEILGFQNHSFFTRFFRLATGKTPGEFVREE